MKKLFVFFTLLLVSCTVYTEKQTEMLSQNTYATNDSVNKGRIDLAYYYSDQATRIVKPPKHRIAIQSVYEAGDVVKNTKNKEKTQVVLVPKEYQGTKVIVVGSDDYNNLLKDRSVKNQLITDNKNLLKDKEDTTRELTLLKNNNNKMLDKLNSDEKLLIKKDLAILWRNIIIISLLALIALYFYAKFSGLIFL
jgi:hypothetical protein